MWWHAPKLIKLMAIKHFVITDIVTTIFTWFSITAVTQSLAGVIAAMVCGLLTNFFMMALGNKGFRVMLIGYIHGQE
jgi:hypothetical protein